MLALSLCLLLAQPPKAPRELKPAPGLTTRIAPNTSGDVSVGLVEDTATGAAPLWRSATWHAALAAASLHRHRLTDAELLTRVAGPSAPPRLLLAASFSALLRGATPKPGTTLVGDVLPDGTLAAAPDAVRAAAASGATRIGVASDGSDLTALAKELEVELTPLSTLREAHTFFTGERLPARVALPPAELDFTKPEAAVFALLNEKAAAELTRLQRDLATLHARLPADDTAHVTKQTAALKRRLEQADRLVVDGKHVLAYVARASAITFVTESSAYAQFLLAWRAKDAAGLARPLGADNDPFEELTLLMKEIDAQFPPGTVVADAFACDLMEDIQSALAIAVRIEPQRKALLPRVAADDSAPFTELGAYVKDRARISAHAANARRFALGYATLKVTGPAARARTPSLAPLSKALFGAAVATSEALDASALTANALWDDVAVTRKLYERNAGGERLRFVLASRMHFATSLLAFHGDAALQAARSRTAALEACAEAKRSGWIPTMARTHFALATEQGASAPLEAMYGYWLAGFWCDFATQR